MPLYFSVYLTHCFLRFLDDGTELLVQSGFSGKGTGYLLLSHQSLGEV